MRPQAGPTCSCCGQRLDPGHLAWNYVWPDPLAELTKRERRKALRFHSDSFLVADGFGAAIRVILPIHLDTDQTSTIGVWVGLDGEDANRVNSAGRAGGAAWAGCTFSGTLLNGVPPWPDTYGVRITAAVPDERTMPRVTASENEAFKRILTGTWPHAEFLRARPC
ncbi:hypothetical protein Amsp01_020300 [Amycolatopsis sp. NBRC 101858]|uniref:DUF2199 domain-containing protein n=1 Tax=Amycolatopsis sp. NBRC 101858 TaxID=3032200 RepID=UPI0024A159D7|nr:DUF2199 domain-containing protein [Amycolatopsis sp. NBRC 101858]GLY36006.1 hypothetical protein Amsp01_020300 [Amycolatopsis sp. NBRC 101858]